jgi:hypothetical protein
MAYGILYDYLMGQTIDAFQYFGAHFVTKEIENVVETGHRRLEWLGCPPTSSTKSITAGVWETFVPGLHDYQSYKFHFKNAHGSMSIRPIPSLSIAKCARRVLLPDLRYRELHLAR